MLRNLRRFVSSGARVALGRDGGYLVGLFFLVPTLSFRPRAPRAHLYFFVRPSSAAAAFAFFGLSSRALLYAAMASSLRPSIRYPSPNS